MTYLLSSPSSNTIGVEGESNIYIADGLSLYLNASYYSATYPGTLKLTAPVPRQNKLDE